ncbi:MAG: sulfotransferase [Acidobacteria bacterium]|jgi:hypothetical protein|nr:sulfotransferase [Acidobacteriota bacterium]
MTPTPDIVLHVGFSKTGTTTLQKHLFSRHSQVQYLGKPFNDNNFKTLLHQLIMQESTVYDPSELKKYLENEILKKYDPGKKIIVLSEEMLLSYSKTRDKGLVAQRLKEVFPFARVLFTIRDQFEILKAAYLSRGRQLNYVPTRYLGLHVSFREWLALAFENVERSYLGHADYYKTIAYYAGLFGKDKICILLLEELIHNPTQYAGKLADFLGIAAGETQELVKGQHANRGISRFQLEAEALRSRWYPFNRYFLISKLLKIYLVLTKNAQKNQDADVQVPVDLINKISELYKAGNRSLMNEYGLPLVEYGYKL